MRAICRLGEIFLMAGWILPFWFSGSALFEYIRMELTPRLLGEQPLNSFPYLDFSWKTFSAGCLWLGIAIGYRVIRLHSEKTQS